ncbi:MAG: L-ribulose-5-phosphate 3-epimerase [Spirochaetaceae bacterium]|jgi:L-ribulose-5-phosphate 3-epimerase|nr:L-ribulose-5-phosphate 3-epimerase [Spirochaetaceae bacterium]
MKDYSIGLYEKALPPELSWREKCAAAKACGYDFLEISIDETEEKLRRLRLSRVERRELAETLYEADLPVRTMCLSGHRKYPLGSANPQTRARSLAIMEGALDFAADLGIRVIQLAGYDVYYEPSTEQSRALFCEGLERAVAMAAARGVMLAFETMETEFMNTVAKAMEYVRKINSPWLGVYPDSGNITCAARAYNTSVLDDMRAGSGAVCAVHLKESAPGRFREVPYGTGHVDFPALIRCARADGTALFVTEFWYCGEPDYAQVVRAAKTFIDEQFRQAAQPV